MRFHRVRYTRPSAPRVTKRREGVETCLNSPYGRAEKRTRLWDSWREQSGVCARCALYVDLSEAKLESDEFVEGTPNRMVHKRCPNSSN